MTVSEIIHSIDARLRDLEREIMALKQARGELVNGVRSAAPVKASARKRRQRREPQRSERHKPTQVVPAGMLERLLGESDGLNTAALAKQADADNDQVLVLLKELEAAGRVRHSVERHATRWRRFTDEDAIAERAAELAARSKSVVATPTAGG